MRKGIDVYLFLTGMMLIAELARQEGLFDWLAALAVAHARGSPHRLFALVYAVGILVTVLLVERRHRGRADTRCLRRRAGGGCDAIAVSLRLRLHRQCGELCASDIEPGKSGHLRRSHAALGGVARHSSLLPSIVSIGVTYLALRLTQRRALATGENCARRFRGRGSIMAGG